MSRPPVLIALARLLGRGYAIEARLGDRIAAEARADAHLRIGRLALVVEDDLDWVVLTKTLDR